MILINCCGGAGCRKSTTAEYLNLALKKLGYNSELVGEAAREYAIYDGRLDLLENQILITGLQYERIRRLERAGIEIAVSDSPLIQGVMYSHHLPYCHELQMIIRILEKEWPTYNVFVHRVGEYNPSNRFCGGAGTAPQTKVEVLRRDQEARGLVGEFWLEIEGSGEGQRRLVAEALYLIGGIDAIKLRENQSK